MSATARALSPQAPPTLTKAESLCLEAYYGLTQDWAAGEVGSEEIRRWVRVIKDVRPPSNTTVLTALRKAKVVHRKAGKPLGGRARLDAVGSPFLPGVPPRRRGKPAR